MTYEFTYVGEHGQRQQEVDTAEDAAEYDGCVPGAA